MYCPFSHPTSRTVGTPGASVRGMVPSSSRLPTVPAVVTTCSGVVLDAM